MEQVIELLVQAYFVYSLGTTTGCNFHIDKCVLLQFSMIFFSTHTLVQRDDGKVSINIWNKTRMKICFAFDLKDFIEFIRAHRYTMHGENGKCLSLNN